MRWSLLLPSVIAGCALAHSAAYDTAVAPVGPLPDLEVSPPPSPRGLSELGADQLSQRIDSWFEGHGTRRLHVQLDRPLYRPGESVWIKTWNIGTRALEGTATDGIAYELVDPRGTVVEKKDVLQSNGTATNDFVLPVDAPGGQWTIRARLGSGEVDERPFVVASFQAPRIHKTLDFVREAYGPGDRVEALVELVGPSGEPLAEHPVRALLQVDGETVLESAFTTDATGAVLVSGELPASLSSGDGLLTVLVDEGGVTESISRSVPIVVADLKLAFFPEGGDLVAGLPARVYFEGQDRHGEPADVRGVIEDPRGAVVASFESLHDGMGRFAFTPQPGQRYVARVTAPEGLKQVFPLPEARAEGCTLRSYDDVRSETSAVRMAVRCTRRQDVTVTSVLREQELDTAAVTVVPGADTVVYLTPPAPLREQQGAVRVTVFDGQLAPLAERLVYRNPGRDLRVELTPDRTSYGPRDEVVVKVRSTDPSGAPVPAELAVSVVDDAVLGLADDEEGHLLTRMYLEPELVDSPEDPAWYFDPDEALAARGLDLVLGTRGWRRFEWQQVWNPAPVVATTSAPSVDLDAAAWADVPMPPQAEAFGRPMDAVPAAMAPPPMAGPMGGVAMEEQKAVAAAVAERRMAAKDDVAGQAPLPDWCRGGGRAKRDVGARWRGDARDELAGLGYFGGEDLPWREPVPQWAPVRVFPRPDHQSGFTGVRTDFRDTVHWEPTVRTDANGQGEVRFVLSDAVATFRVTAEGLGSGYAGHREATFASVLPVSLSTHLPPAVSAGDRLVLPLTVTNSRPQPIDVGLETTFGSAVLTTGHPTGRLRVDARGSDTFWVPVTVGSGNEEVTLRLSAEGGGATDTIEQRLKVVPAGFPRTWSAAGELERVSEHHFTLDDVVPDSLVARVQWHPSTVSTLISGMEGLISTPGGCFEQTSSTNWPNVAILHYLEAHDGDPRLRARSGAALETGYGILTGYQVDAGGFETWGSGPGKEALSAFGLLEFTDMSHVYPVADSVLSRNAKYLLGARDGHGGYTNSGESAHGYGSAPKDVLDGFITWALVATGHAEALKAEIEAQAATARTTQDPYVLALATRTLVRTNHPGATAAVDRLARLQDANGSFPGATSSITRSGESNLLVESTALATLALLDAGDRFPAADRGADWLVKNRQGVGTWGATQATALALEALTTHAEQARRPRTGGHLSVEVNGEAIGALDYEADQSTPLVIDGLAAALHRGDNTIVLRHSGGEPLPFTVDVGWTTLNPGSAPDAELGLRTSLDSSRVTMGETVRLTARLDNRTKDVVPSPIARIGLPAGLEPQLWQLKELQDRGEIAFFETRPREVTLYWDGLHVNEGHEVRLDLLAAVPGSFTGPASSAWPYYDDDDKAWSKGLGVTIDTP